MAPHLERVIIVDSSPGSVRLLRDSVRLFSKGKIHCVESPDHAFELAKTFNPQLMVVDLGSDPGDGLQMVRRIRRSYMPSRYAPIIAASSRANADVVFAARDAGVHEFLIRPFTTLDISRRLIAVTLKSRDWIEGMRYVGPDRRRFNSATFRGDNKRLGGGVMSDSARLQQTLKFVEFAIAFKDHDPSQALRSLRAQAEPLLDLGIAFDDPVLVKEAQAFMRYVTCMTEFDLSRTDELLDTAYPLLSRLVEARGAVPDFEPELDDAERQSLKSWRNYAPSSHTGLVPA